ncbi:MAG: membrane protein insertase YidC, partial [Desulfobacterales bacterium]
EGVDRRRVFGEDRLVERGVDAFVLKHYRVRAEREAPPMNLLPEKETVEVLAVGLAKAPGLAEGVRGFQAEFAGERIDLVEGKAELLFRSRTPQGMAVEKRFRFRADSYVIDLEVRFVNQGERSFSDSPWVALRNEFPPHKNSSSFEGPSALVDRSLEQIAIGDIAKKGTLGGTVRWLALETRYFMTALIPVEPGPAEVVLRSQPGNRVEARFAAPVQAFEPGVPVKLSFELFFGPKSLQVVRGVGRDLERIIDFGTFDWLAKPCLWVLNFFYRLIPNYGVAIIILTVITKILLWPLGTKSYKSMNQMKKLQPLLQEIRNRYKNDRKKMNEEIMRLHRTYNINPLGGCLPMLVQIPVFFALYRMLDQAIELRHAPFFGWINDLSAPDRLGNFDFAIPLMEPPYGIPVLTLVMGATMLWQQKMTPSTGDPTQAKLMMLMPAFFTFIFINFSSGLVLYWLVNNVLSIGQQYYTQKKFG